MPDTLTLTSDLIKCQSVTPEDAGCQRIIEDRLLKAGFTNHRVDVENVKNLWSVRGSGSPLLVLAGHTDVVPAGNPAQWLYDPFVPTVKDGMLYGRGAADMKGGLAAMVVAVERFVSAYPDHDGRIAFLITSDEEGDAYYGTVAVMEWLAKQGEQIDWAIVGEPSSVKKMGDTVKVGRRGSMLGSLTIHGVQGHVAYPHLARNPVHQFAPALTDLSCEMWDEGNDSFPPTSFQISNFNSGTGASNVIPGEAQVQFSFRYSTEVTVEQLQQRVRAILDQHRLEYTLEFEVKGYPFLTPEGTLTKAVSNAIERVTGQQAELSTSGGTSDARFIAPTGAQVVELGVVNETIHRVNECVCVDDLERLSEVYFAVLENLMIHSKG